MEHGSLTAGITLDLWWHGLSLLWASLAVYALFEMTAQVRVSQGIAKLAWLLSGSGAIGVALWSTAFMGTQSLGLQSVAGCDWPSALISLIAVIAGCVALLLVASHSLTAVKTVASVLQFGTAIVAMSYLQVRSMRIAERVTFSSDLVLLAFLLSLGVAYLALKQLTMAVEKPQGRLWHKVASSLCLGLMILAVHFIAMTSVRVVPGFSSVLDLHHAIQVSSVALSSVAFAAFAFLTSLLVAAALDRRNSAQTRDFTARDERHRITNALNEQRVMSLQNEALTEEILERRKAEAKLTYAAFHDSVTGLHNRSHLINVLQKTLNQVSGSPRPRAALIYIDLDKFKAVNDLLGHRGGDLFLLEIGSRLKNCVRDGDTLARMGGDEFTLLLSGVHTTDSVFRLAQRILTLIEEPVDLAGTLLFVAASIGICEIDASYDEAEEVMRNADTAMYYAKRNGGGNCQIYQPRMQDEIVAAMRDKADLKAAVENEQFELYYQPLVDMRDKSIYGMEALIRWNHPIRGLVTPGSFIPLAEETGHIRAIGSWVLRRACEDFLEIRKIASKDLLLTLNVSTQQFEGGGFLEELQDVLDTTGMPTNMLQLEITESIFIKDASRMGSLFKDIRALGVKIAFDDFGTGYSSLSYVERYPIDTLKIDQSFVQRMRKGSVNAEIVKMVIKLAYATGMSVSAEGVEEPDQAASLIGYGCHLAQGYLYSKPVSLSEILALVEHGLKLQSRPALVRANLVSAIR